MRNKAVEANEANKVAEAIEVNEAAEVSKAWKITIQSHPALLMFCLLNPQTNACELGFPLSRDFSNFQVPGLLDLLSPGTTGPRDLQGL